MILAVTPFYKIFNLVCLTRIDRIHHFEIFFMLKDHPNGPKMVRADRKNADI